MILGNVSLRCEAMLPLVVDNANGQQQVIDAVIDTGFNGFLTLPSEMLNLIYLGMDQIQLHWGMGVRLYLISIPQESYGTDNSVRLILLNQKQSL